LALIFIYLPILIHNGGSTFLRCGAAVEFFLRNVFIREMLCFSLSEHLGLLFWGQKYKEITNYANKIMLSA
jgi:hypothetical protein